MDNTDNWKDYYNAINGLENNSIPSNPSYIPSRSTYNPLYPSTNSPSSSYNSSYSPFANALFKATNSKPNQQVGEAAASPIGTLLRMAGMPETVQGTTRQKYGNNIADTLNIMSSVSQRTQEMLGKKDNVANIDITKTPDRELLGFAIESLGGMASGRSLKEIASFIKEQKLLDKAYDSELAYNKLMSRVNTTVSSEYAKTGNYKDILKSPTYTDKLLEARIMAAKIDDPKYEERVANALHSIVPTQLHTGMLRESITKMRGNKIESSIEGIKNNINKLSNLQKDIPTSLANESRPSLEEFSNNSGKYAKDYTKEDLINIAGNAIGDRDKIKRISDLPEYINTNKYNAGLGKGSNPETDKELINRLNDILGNRKFLSNLKQAGVNTQ